MRPLFSQKDTLKQMLKEFFEGVAVVEKSKALLLEEKINKKQKKIPGLPLKIAE